MEAEKLNLTGHHLYYSLLGNLYEGIDNNKAKECLQRSLNLARTTSDKKVISRNLVRLVEKANAEFNEH